MLSAIAPRTDSAQNSEERLKPTRDSSPLKTSPLANSSSADVVVSNERAKSPEIIRALSPVRSRRTPVLVNAPDVHWRLAQAPHLRHVSSLDSVVSSSASESSTFAYTPQNIALSASYASSVLTTISEDVDPVDIPLPLSPPPDVFMRSTDAREPPRSAQVHYFLQPHPLSPITEVSSAPSIRSSIVDLTIQNVGTAEQQRIASVGKLDVNIVGQTQNPISSPQS